MNDADIEYIPLTRGKVAIVDREDYEWLSQHSWHATPVGRNKEYFYVYRNSARRGTKLISMHREIMDAQTGEIIDHINGNTLDNRRSNLRRCTKSENKRNSHKCIRATRGKPYKGIGQDKRYPGRFFAAVYVGGKKIYGAQRFDTEIEAAREYDRLAVQYYGEFANLNFPLTRSKGQDSA